MYMLSVELGKKYETLVHACTVGLSGVYVRKAGHLRMQQVDS